MSVLIFLLLAVFPSSHLTLHHLSASWLVISSPAKPRTHCVLPLSSLYIFSVLHTHHPFFGLNNPELRVGIPPPSSLSLSSRDFHDPPSNFHQLSPAKHAKQDTLPEPTLSILCNSPKVIFLFLRNPQHLPSVTILHSQPILH